MCGLPEAIEQLAHLPARSPNSAIAGSPTRASRPGTDRAGPEFHGYRFICASLNGAVRAETPLASGPQQQGRLRPFIHLGPRLIAALFLASSLTWSA